MKTTENESEAFEVGYGDALLRVAEAPDLWAELPEIPEDVLSSDVPFRVGIAGHGLASNRFLLHVRTERFACDVRRLLPVATEDDDGNPLSKIGEWIRVICRFAYAALTHGAFCDGVARIELFHEYDLGALVWRARDAAGNVLREGDTWEGGGDVLADVSAVSSEEFIRV